jgi:hypothetical protein
MIAAIGSRPVIAISVLCAVVQIASATVQQRTFESPNMAAEMARSLAERGTFEVAGRRAYQLPGESWYLALGFAVLPDHLHRYLHVPVTVVLVTAIAAVASAIAGPAAALGAGLMGTADPFVIVHGPVWDDTFLAAALEWAILATVVGWLAGGSVPAAPMAYGVGVAAACAALTRTASPIPLLSLGAALAVMPSLRRLRRVGVALVVGVVLALTMWAARNFVVLGTFYAGTTRDGKTLYEANCAYTRQGIRETGVVGGFLDRCDPDQAAHVGRLGEVAADWQLRRYALDYMMSNPLDVSLTAMFKLAVSLTGYDFASPLTSLRNLVGVSSSLLVIVIGASGLALLRRHPARNTPVAVVIAIAGLTTLAATLAMLAVGPVGLRYRISLTAFLYLGVGVLITRLVERAVSLPMLRAIPTHVSIR